MRKLLLLVIITAIILCCIFPPWLRIYKEEKSNIRKFEPVGYSFITEPPEVYIYSPWGVLKGKAKADTIDFGRLTVQVGLLLFLGSIIIFSKYIFPQRQKKPKHVSSDDPLPKKRKRVAKTLAYLTVCHFNWLRNNSNYFVDGR